jgi:hypothetical protein
VAEKTNDLKSVHFILGKDPHRFGKIASTAIGRSASTSTAPAEPEWATLKSNFDMGADKRGKLTDYQSRFKNSFSKAAGDPTERIANKEKLVADAVFIGGDATTLAPNTMKNYKDTFTKCVNGSTYLTPFAADNIRRTHYVIGMNNQHTTHTEHNTKFMKTEQDRKAAWSLAPERIQFFKDAHFKHGSGHPDLDKFHEKTNQKLGYPSHGALPKPTADECSAYRIRHGTTILGSTDPKFPTPYVTS